MGYQFAGFFASPSLPRPAVLPERAVWREVISPFVGVGVRLRDLLGKTPTRVEVEALARQLGLAAADRWLYLTYDCWGGGAAARRCSRPATRIVAIRSIRLFPREPAAELCRSMARSSYGFFNQDRTRASLRYLVRSLRPCCEPQRRKGPLSY